MNVIKVKGYTLIEIMIVVAILGVIAAIAFPNFAAHGQRAKRADATEALLSGAALQERWFIQNRQYVTATASLDDVGGDESKEGFYSLTVSNVVGGTTCTNSECYTLTATPVAGKSQANDSDCQRFTVDNLGRKQAFNATSGGTETTDLCW